MIIISKEIGQLCNQLFLFSNIITIGIELDREVLNPSFYKNSKYFKGTRNNKFSKFPARKNKSIIPEKIIVQLLKWYVHISPFFVFSTYRFNRFKFLFRKIMNTNYDHYFENGFYFDRDSYSQRVKKLKSGNIKMVNGFLFFNTSGMKKNRQILCDYFEPCDEYKIKPDQFLDNQRTQLQIVIGLHIRRGDYRAYREGKYFYSDDEYNNILNNLEECFKRLKIKIIIVSDEKVSSFLTCKKNVSSFAGNKIEDLYLLSECDYIVGPPSTFSKWASFYGEKPLYVIENPARKISVEDFHVRYNHYN